MIDRHLDLWGAPCDARCVTTNGTITARGRGVMGRGVAKQAAQKYQHLPLYLGRYLRAHGNHVGVLIEESVQHPALVVFPVKHEWSDRADLDLIARSATELMALIEARGWETVLLPRPGCGNGQRTWEEVREVIELVLDWRVWVVWQ